ncbi:DBF4-type zinc finger-containing protein 2 homolog [Neopelma chrysocephalum]|uniref:DBF4-type zinc finger-containing protein 2 homolog n=1 Tax=Neopelma chrysocephalum TaxID=114329 RepID=UPI000FCCFDA1|nr:DBF4-type zinc finger-containing protein 2 homolog [Neopelma chrysocephalum]
MAVKNPKMAPLPPLGRPAAEMATRGRARPFPASHADAAMPLAKDLLHPSPEEEKRKHKKKRLVQSPNSYFMDVKCPGGHRGPCGVLPRVPLPSRVRCSPRYPSVSPGVLVSFPVSPPCPRSLPRCPGPSLSTCIPRVPLCAPGIRPCPSLSYDLSFPVPVPPGVL